MGHARLDRDQISPGVGDVATQPDPDTLGCDADLFGDVGRQCRVVEFDVDRLGAGARLERHCRGLKTLVSRGWGVAGCQRFGQDRRGGLSAVQSPGSIGRIRYSSDFSGHGHILQDPALETKRPRAIFLSDYHVT